ncbi:MAG: bifunctional proline dehydrogenase/L-glutamate gamma-semialdehyde dehydrogenase [Nitrospira sp.]|nr:MAG: bifunctional proline dehydrogenase/L-glutamate gamma-semialdehyde dehydrogenase [Nitrospira sp.]
MPLDPALLEPRIRAIGEDLAHRSSGLAPGLFDSRWWSQAAINLAMKDPAFKAQLFRFIDVLPSLREDGQVVRLAEEYFGEMGANLFGAQWGLRALGSTKLGATLSGKALRHQVEQIATSFIAGASIDEALPRLRALWQEGRAFSVDLLGEASVSEREADAYRDRCLATLQVLGEVCSTWPSLPLLERDHLGSLPRIQLSIKISALYSQLDPIDPDGSYRVIAARLRPLLNVAVTLPASVIFDMEQAETKEVILLTFMRLLSEEPYRTYPHAGVALQAYRTDTEADVRRLLDWTAERGVPITIRLVKGAYWDSDAIRYRQRGWPLPLFVHKAETDVNYEALIRLLLEQHPLVRPAFGTHNLRSLAVVEAVAESLKLPPEAWEYQMIYGMAEPFQHAMTDRGRRLRLYTPVGALLPGMAYLVRRLLENTSNESFLRKEYVESQPLSLLLSPPLPGPHPPSASPEAAHPDPAGGCDQEFVNEPLSDFSHQSVRDAMARSLDLVRVKLGSRLDEAKCALVPPAGPELRSLNPSRPEQVVAIVQGYAPSNVPALMAAAEAHAAAWRDRSVAERVAILRKAAALMRRQRWDLAAWEVFEEGKPWREADADVAEAIDFLEYYATGMERLGAPLRLGRYPGELNELSWRPRGITVVIAPWNFPLAIPTGMVSAALVCGNPVLFKPSERSFAVGYQLTRVLTEAGVPAGALQYVPGGPDVGRELVQAAGVATIAFTGSKDVGLGIIQAAAARDPKQRAVKRVIAEMGGKNAIIVDDTADLDEAVTGVVTSFTGYAGQKCSACSRVIVTDGVHDEFLQRLADAVRSLRLGAADDPATQVGPVIDGRAQQRIADYVAIGRREGRVVVDRSAEGVGTAVGPVVVADIDPSDRLAKEEIFGPVLAVMRASSFEQALQLANGTDYALTGGLYSRSPRHIDQARQAFDVGNLYINRAITGALVGRQPFGGHRLSGVGAKAGGEDYLKQFMTAHVVSEQTLRRGFAPTP